MGSLIQLWLAIRPIKRIREARAAKRAASAAAGATLSVGESEVVSPPATVETSTYSTPAAPVAEDSGMFGELAKSWARSALKIAGAAVATAAVTHGMFDPSNTDAVQMALETIGGGVATLFGLWWSHRAHA